MKRLLLFAVLPFTAQAAFSQCVAPAAPTQAYASPATFCSNTAVTTDLNATTAAAFINWYTVPTGGTPIGNSFSASNFPVTLSTTTTYYAEAVATGGTVSNTYSYTGAVQTFTVPTGVDSVTIEVWGAQGNSNPLGIVGGFGGYATGRMAVNAGDILYINVGGGGANSSTGGFNGGGNGGNTGNPTSFGGGGGGASDVCYLNNTVNDRVIVGAGGGGAAGNRVAGLGRGNGGGGGGGYYGGGGGAAWPNASVVVPTGGTQTSGGTGGTSTYTTLNPTNNGTAGGFGIGGNGGLENTSNQAGSQNGSIGAVGGGLTGSNGTYAGNFSGQSGAGGSSYTSPAMVNASTTAGVQSGNGQVTITYIDHCPSPTRTPVTVTINPIPVVTASATPSISVCENSNVTLYGSGAVSYAWVGPVSVTDNTPFTASLLANGSYLVTGTDAAGCVDTASITLNVVAAPVVVTTASNSAICNGDSTVISASGATFYTWSNGGNTASQTVAPSASATYLVEGQDSITGCYGYDTLSITVNPLPTVSAASATPAICNGDSTLITASGADLYLWSSGDTAATITVNPSANTTYVVTGTVAATGCFASDTVVLTVNQLPIVIATNSVDTICAGSSSTLTASGAVAYLWSTGGNAATEVVTPTATTTYTVTGTDSLGCSNTDQTEVVVNALPVVTVSLSANSICVDDGPFSLTGGSPSGGTWSGTGVTGSTFNAGAAGLGSQQITYTFTNAAGCTDSATTSIDVTACTGIVENNGNSTVTLFPNPATEQLKITWSNTVTMKTIVITDVTGREVSSVAVNGINTTTIRVAELPAGIYNVNATDANGVHTTTRFIKN